jgi:hypothetical protein
MTPAIRPADRPGEYLAQSSDGTREYLVSWSGYVFECECRGFQYRGRCRHAAAVATMEPDRNHDGTTTAPAPRKTAYQEMFGDQR